MSFFALDLALAMIACVGQSAPILVNTRIKKHLGKNNCETDIFPMGRMGQPISPPDIRETLEKINMYALLWLNSKKYIFKGVIKNSKNIIFVWGS